LRGDGDYKNPKRRLKRIPDSKDFGLDGEPVSGLTIKSVSNSLELSLEPIPLRPWRGKMMMGATGWEPLRPFCRGKDGGSRAA